jgi:hypothetical protein
MNDDDATSQTTSQIPVPEYLTVPNVCMCAWGRNGEREPRKVKSKTFPEPHVPQNRSDAIPAVYNDGTERSVGEDGVGETLWGWIGQSQTHSNQIVVGGHRCGRDLRHTREIGWGAM